jgi:23S rRNA pseudouridine1911/1915/1917 synthase
MNRNLTFVISNEHVDRKLVNYLKFQGNMSTRLTRKLIRGGLITINGTLARSNDLLKEGDKIDVVLETKETQDIIPQDIPIEVAYEDVDLLIVNKPPFMVVHPTRSHIENTLANGIMNYFKITNQDCIVRLVNRLDRDTSGLVIIAKSQYAHQGMAKKLDNNQIEKTYIAVVEGRLEGKDTIDMPIDRPAPESMKREVMEGGQRAVTHYEALVSSDNMSILSIRLETGKTHQIRVHMKTIGHPIVGDSLYGNVSEYIDRQALHAHRLRFSSLRDNIDVEVLAELPEDMKKLYEIVERISLVDKNV